MRALVLVFLLSGVLTVIPPAVPRALSQPPGIVLILDNWPARPRRHRNHYARRLAGGNPANG